MRGAGGEAGAPGPRRAAAGGGLWRGDSGEQLAAPASKERASGQPGPGPACTLCPACTFGPLYTLCPAPCALPAPLVLSAPCALPVPFTLHPPCTLHPVPCLHPAHSLHPAYTLLSRCSCSLHPLRALPLPTPCPCPTCSPPTPCLHPCPASTAAHTLPSPSPGTWGYPCLHAPGQSTVAEGGEPGSAAANLLSPPNKASGRNLWALRSCTAPALGSCLHTAAL